MHNQRIKTDFVARAARHKAAYARRYACEGEERRCLVKKVLVVLGVSVVVVALKAEVEGSKEGAAIAVPAKDADREQNAKSVAKEWFKALMSGDVPTTMALSELPFALDRKRIIRNSQELKDVYEQVASKKGKRDLKPTKVTVFTSKSEIIQGCIPVDALVVHILIEDEGVAVSVRPGDAYRVVGFSD